MQWEGISEFVNVAEIGSFTQAAKRLGISTPQVSRQVTALEQRLKVKLLYRTTRKVSLTEEGQLFYQHCRSVLEGLDAAERAVTNLQSRPQGKIKLTAPVTYGEQQVLPLVNDFVLLYPDIQVTAYLSNHQLDIIDEGYDVGIRMGKLRNSGMMAKKLATRINYVCAAPAYLQTHGTPHSLAELSKHNCLLGTLDYWHFLDESDKGKKPINSPGGKNLRVNGTIRYNSGVALLDATLKGLGIAQLPGYYVAEHIQNGSLVSLLDDHQESDEGIWAVYPHNRHLSPKIRLLVDFLADRLEGNDN